MKKNRNINLDIIRCVAIFFVIGVHFFLNTYFYSEIINGKSMYCALLLKNLFLVCVPLFMLLTGYLMNEKKISVAYYKGLIKTLEIYVLSCIFILGIKKFYFQEDMGMKDWFKFIIGFDGYAWYVEMYIGLFLLIPFLNLIWNGLKNIREKKILIFTFFVCTVLPSIPFIFNIDDIGRRWWQGLYPLTYYFIGAYIREYDIKISIKINAILLIMWLLFWNSINFYKSYGRVAEATLYIQEYYGIVPFLTSILLFLVLLHIETDKLPQYMKRMITVISELSFGMYLMSWVVDSVFYPRFNEMFPVYYTRILAIGIVIPFVFICSALCSWTLSVIVKGRKQIIHKIRKNKKCNGGYWEDEKEIL